MSATLAEFLTARLDEREAAARAAVGRAMWADNTGEWESVGGFGQRLVQAVAEDGARTQVADLSMAWYPGERQAHIARHDPAWVLADIAAKRALIAAVAEVAETIDAEWGPCTTWHKAADILAGVVIREGEPPVPLPVGCKGTEVLNRLLGPTAALDSTHPDYRQEWAPRRGWWL